MKSDWRTDKRLITFSFVKKYCPYRQYDEHSLISRCPKIKRTLKAKLHPLCSRKHCLIWNELEEIKQPEVDFDSLLLNKIEKLIE